MSVEQSDMATEAAAFMVELTGAAGSGEAEALYDLVCDDAILYKVGHVRGRTEMIEAVREFGAKGGRAQYEFKEMTTRVDGRLATLTFHTHAKIHLPGEAVRTARWLESVILERSDRWRLVFYHSTEEAALNS